jgi:polyisoprenoid-binding protein YceI
MPQDTMAPAVATFWQVDSAHTDVEFAVRHLMISTVKGRFGSITGRVAFDPDDPGSLALDVTIPVATVDTRVEQRDQHLRSADFFDADRFPEMHFVGRRVDGDIASNFRLTGDLTIRDVTRPITLEVTAEGRTRDPWGNERLGFRASGQLDRGDFGFTYNQALETGGVLVGETVRITINMELVAASGE